MPEAASWISDAAYVLDAQDDWPFLLQTWWVSLVVQLNFSLVILEDKPKGENSNFSGGVSSETFSSSSVSSPESTAKASKLVLEAKRVCGGGALNLLIIGDSRMRQSKEVVTKS